MRASVFPRLDPCGPPGGPATAAVPVVVDVPAPEARAGEVRVRVRAAGVPPCGTDVLAGRRPPGTVPGSAPIPGDEFAGTVDRVGRGVRGFAPGDEVLGFRVTGCHAEYVVVPAMQLARRPAGLPWDQAGALPASGQVAHASLRELGITAGETLLVHGAAGGVGTIAVQLAIGLGATVIGTASAANHPYLSSLGAVPVPYGEGLAARVRRLAPQGVDAAFDTAGRGAVRASLDLGVPPERIGSLVDACACRSGARLLRPGRTHARLAALVALHEQGGFRVQVRARYPLERVAEAHCDAESGHGRGRVVLVFG